MKKILSYILTSLFLFLFGVYLLIFHVIQFIAYNLGGRKWQAKAVDGLTFFLFNSLKIAGVKIEIENFEGIPKDRPLILVANHHSLHDITGIGWIMRGFDLAFVSKAELGKRIPSISYNLRKSSSALINRKDKKQSISEILRMAKHIEKNKSAVCIFPEGTRKHRGDLLRTFKPAGTTALIKKAPSALIVPIAISGTWNLGFPIPFGSKIKFERLKDVEPSQFDNLDDVILECQNQIHSAVIQDI
jgi:1-acyl-sn-glycerol-3-phosphate acyltransferase